MGLEIFLWVIVGGLAFFLAATLLECDVNEKWVVFCVALFLWVVGVLFMWHDNSNLSHEMRFDQSGCRFLRAAPVSTPSDDEKWLEGARGNPAPATYHDPIMVYECRKAPDE